MKINYELAKEYAVYVQALAMTEHFGHVIDDKCLTEQGDFIDVTDAASFRALGLMQLHPSFILQYYGTGSFSADVNDSHVDMQIKAAASYFEKYMHSWGLDATVQAYNKGVAGYQRGERNPTYLRHFDAMLNFIRPMYHI